MLVRFLSYAASVIGAKRYKPLLISCLALIFSITGVSIVASSVTSRPTDTASQVNPQNGSNQSSTGQQQTSLGDLEQKSTKDNDAIKPPQEQPNSPDTNNRPPSNTTPDAVALGVTLNTATVSLSQASPNTAVTVATNDDSLVQWSITPEASNGITARIEQPKDKSGSAVVRFRADAITPGTYQFTVTAKDLGQNISASKTITVTVN